LQKITAEGLSNYWQIRTADEVVEARRELATIAGQMIDDARARVNAGKLSDLALGQMERELAVRQSDLLRAEQTRDELKLRLLSTLNLPSDQLAAVQLVSTYGQMNAGSLDDLDQILSRWAPYQIARLRKEQGVQRLAFARNQQLPAADLVVSLSQSGMSENNYYARRIALGQRFPEWYVGMNVELGLWGERKASAQMVAQQNRVNQSDTELAAIRIAFANDWFARQQAWGRAQSELKLMRTESASRQRMAQAEQQRLDAGMGSRAAAWIAQQDALESHIRLLDAQGRAESARLSLLLAQGKLLDTYGVSFEISQGL
jgi:outer membrane protein TolC